MKRLVSYPKVLYYLIWMMSFTPPKIRLYRDKFWSRVILHVLSSILCSQKERFVAIARFVVSAVYFRKMVTGILNAISISRGGVYLIKLILIS